MELNITSIPGILNQINVSVQRIIQHKSLFLKYCVEWTGERHNARNCLFSCVCVCLFFSVSLAVSVLFLKHTNVFVLCTMFTFPRTRVCMLCIVRLDDNISLLLQYLACCSQMILLQQKCFPNNDSHARHFFISHFTTNDELWYSNVWFSSPDYILWKFHLTAEMYDIYIFNTIAINTLLSFNEVS